METPRTVTLDEVLAAREARAAHQRALLARHPFAALVCLTVNVPGPVKRTPEARRVFAAGISALLDALARAGLSAERIERRCPDTGCEAYVVVDAGAETLKRLACALEESLPYGRLLDLDVHTKKGQIPRTQVGYAARGCMVCGRGGAYCASRRAHPLAEILAAFARLARLAPEVDA